MRHSFALPALCYTSSFLLALLANFKGRDIPVEALIFFRQPGFFFVLIVVIAIFYAFYQVFYQEEQVSVFFELLNMRQFMSYPFAVIDKLLPGGIVQQNGAAQYHRHLILFQLAGCQAGQEGIFFDIIFHRIKLAAAQ